MVTRRKRGRPKGSPNKPKGTKSQFWNDEVNLAIKAFQLSKEQKERNELFKVIYPAFQKLADVIMTRANIFLNVEEIRETILSKITMMLLEGRLKCDAEESYFSYTYKSAFYGWWGYGSKQNTVSRFIEPIYLYEDIVGELDVGIEEFERGQEAQENINALREAVKAELLEEERYGRVRNLSFKMLLDILALSPEAVFKKYHTVDATYLSGKIPSIQRLILNRLQDQGFSRQQSQRALRHLRKFLKRVEKNIFQNEK